LIELNIRVRVTALNAYQPIEEPVMPAIRGAIPVKNTNVTAIAEPRIEPKAACKDLPYPASISFQDEYMRVDAMAEPFATQP
jgi:hypothetical protein